MTNDTYKQIIGELEQKLHQANLLNVRHRAQIKALKADVKELASELEQERSREPGCGCQRKEQNFLAREHDDAKGV